MRLAFPTLILAIILVLGWRVCSGGERDHLQLTERDLPIELREGYEAATRGAREAAEGVERGLEGLAESAATATSQDANVAALEVEEKAPTAPATAELADESAAPASLETAAAVAESASPQIDPPSLPSVSSPSTAEPATEAAPAAEPRIYVVQPGEWLMQIAREQYGDPAAAKKIAQANGLNDADRLRPGQELILP